MSVDDVTKLRRYCAENFAASAVFVDSPGEVVWLGTRDRTRAVTSHRTSARAVLAKLHIPTAGLRGTRLVLNADETVRAAAAEHRVDRPTQLRAASTCVADDAGTRAPREAARAGDTESRCNEGVDEDPDVKVIVLGTSHRGGAASSFCFQVLR